MAEGGRLHIARITEEDQGLYVCRATNERGSAESSAYIRVTGKQLCVCVCLLLLSDHSGRKPSPIFTSLPCPPPSMLPPRRPDEEDGSMRATGQRKGGERKRKGKET